MATDMPTGNPPYFDRLFARLAAGDPQTAAAFGRHVHWGWWERPGEATLSAEQYGEAAERLCRLVCDAGGVGDGLRVLDVGCGFGGTLASLNERFDRLQMVGVNIDARQLARAAETVVARGTNTVQFVEADAAQIPLEDHRFDVVLAVECVFHFDRPRFFAEAARLLRPGGNLTLSDFVPQERAVEFLQLMNAPTKEAVRWSYGKIDLTCSLERYRELASSVGLSLSGVTDITAGTLPTYEFLDQDGEHWREPADRERFRRATALLAKASRKGLLRYLVLRFEKPPAAA